MQFLYHRTAFAVLAALLAAGCQSSNSTDQTLSSAAPAAEPAPATAAQQPAAVALAPQPPATAAQCTIQLAGGPPPIPARGADFGQAMMKDTGKAAGRGAVQLLGGMIGGGIGSAVGGGIAKATIRPEGDIKGVWTITDGRPDCACQVAINSPAIITGKGADTGFVKFRGCSDPRLTQVAHWALGYSFTGYDAKFELKASDKKTVLATLNRDGAHYFSGTLSDGTPLTIWREGQTYNQLASFK